MDVADITVLLSSGAGAGALTVLSRDLWRFLRARRSDRKDEITREDKRLSDCEERFNGLSAEITKVQESVRTILLEKVQESARAMTTAAETQREGNIVIREQTKAIGEVTKEIARLVQKLKDNTPAEGNPTQGAKS